MPVRRDQGKPDALFYLCRQSLCVGRGNHGGIEESLWRVQGTGEYLGAERENNGFKLPVAGFKFLTFYFYILCDLRALCGENFQISAEGEKR